MPVFFSLFPLAHQHVSVNCKHLSTEQVQEILIIYIFTLIRQLHNVEEEHCNSRFLVSINTVYPGNEKTQKMCKLRECLLFKVAIHSYTQE